MPFEGPATDDTRIQVSWNQLVGDETGGSTILSYNLEMQIGGVFNELVGQTTYFQSTSYLIQAGISSGQLYAFRVRARNKWGFGPFSDVVQIRAATNPNRELTAPVTANDGGKILIAWSKPQDRGSPIEEYEIAILTSDGISFSTELQFCNGEDPAIVSSRSCQIPLTTLREEPFNLVYPNLVVAKVRSKNGVGWSDFSN